LAITHRVHRSVPVSAGLSPHNWDRSPGAVMIRDRLGEWLGDEEFAAAFGIRGRPGWSPSRLALVTVLQRAEKLTGWQAAEAVVGRRHVRAS